MKRYRLSFTKSPGDGTGNSFADERARNDMGVCAHLNCGQPIDPPADGELPVRCIHHQDQRDALIETLIDMHKL